MVKNKLKNIIANIVKFFNLKLLFFVCVSALTLISLCVIDGQSKHYVYVAQRGGGNMPIRISGSQMPYCAIGDSMTFSVAVDLYPPQIDHQGLAQISPIDKIAVIQGSVIDNDPLAYVNIYYVTDKDVEISTQTIIIPYKTSNFVFKTTVTLETSNANYFYYRVEAVCCKNEHGYWPNSNGDYYNVTLKQKNKFSTISYNKSINLSKISSLFHRVGVSAANTTDISAKGGTVTLANGNPSGSSTSIEIPEGAISSNEKITITELVPSDLPDGTPPAVSQKPVAVYSFEPEGLQFNKPATISLLYKASDVTAGGYDEKSLKVFWWDGVAWVYLGGEVDTTKKLVKYERLSHFSTYALFPVSALSSSDYRAKERIITPASIDGSNDIMRFDALGRSDDKVNIYDVTGRRIRQLTGFASKVWDGKDENGRLVESGLYIYQIKKADNTVISGTVVVAK